MYMLNDKLEKIKINVHNNWILFLIWKGRCDIIVNETKTNNTTLACIRKQTIPYYSCLAAHARVDSVVLESKPVALLNPNYASRLIYPNYRYMVAAVKDKQQIQLPWVCSSICTKPMIGLFGWIVVVLLNSPTVETVDVANVNKAECLRSKFQRWIGRART